MDDRRQEEGEKVAFVVKRAVLYNSNMRNKKIRKRFLEKRKDKVLHTRVPEELEDALQKKAVAMRIPVSNLIRNILEDAFQFVENVVADGLSITDTIRKDAISIAETTKTGFSALKQARNAKEKTSPDKTKLSAALSQVYGWQEIVLNKNTACFSCSKEIKKSAKAMMSAGGMNPPVFLCRTCFKKSTS